MDPDFVNKYNMLLNRLKQVENFDGTDAAKLPNFLNKIEALIPALNTFDSYYRATLFTYIKNKCTDRAKELVIVRSGGDKVETWHKLKELLLLHYAEREASYALVHKIRSSVLDSNIEQYHQKLSKLKQRLLNRKLTHNDTLYSVEDIERITLQVFRDHLPEPTHSMILRRNARTLEEAYRYIVEVQQQYYTQSGPLATEESATYSTSEKYKSLQRSLSTQNGRGLYDSDKSGGGSSSVLNRSYSSSSGSGSGSSAYNNDYSSRDKYNPNASKSSYYGGVGGYSAGGYAAGGYATSKSQSSSGSSYKTSTGSGSGSGSGSGKAAYGTKAKDGKMQAATKSAWRK